ncbi:hypothetical protein TruAng_001419 [Truncatella angustata]|nr:hypothetical protein TruAng_001419 [Truncatella angustata]
MLFDYLSAVKAMGNLISLGMLEDPIKQSQSTTTGTTAKSAVNTQESTICGDIINESNEGAYLFWASDVHDCLSNVPFSIAPALRYLDYLNTTMQFQSTLAFLKTPPQGYQQPAVDVEVVMERIANNVKAAFYLNQYDFEADVQGLIFAMHDAHVDLRSGIMSQFSFGSQWPIASVSIDGITEPKIYLTDHILQAQNDGWSWTPSALSKINDEDVIDYVTKFAASNSLGRLESHAEWNDLMSHPAQDILGNLNIWTGDATFYPGDELNFTFENKSEPLETYWVSYYNYNEDTGPIANGGDFYNFFVLGLYPATNESASYRIGDSNVAKRSKSMSTPPNISKKSKIARDDNDETSSEDVTTGWSGAYPAKADIYQSDLLVNGSGVVTGYFLRDISTGVLSIPTFEQYGEELYDFSDTVQTFIDSSVTENIKHIVIDLQQNAGGDVVLALDTFARFFPQKQPFAGSRRRSHELGRVLGNATTTWWTSLDPNSDDADVVDNWYEGLADEWVITPRLNAATKKNFHDWEEYAGPRPYLGDWFTLVEEYNLSDEDFNYESMDMSPYGWADNPSTTEQRWDPEDIVLLTDGLCSSTCALFVEFMTRIGVRTIVMGGRPESGPMQAASGTRGARSYWSGDLDNDLAWAGSVDAIANQTFPPIPLNGFYRDSGIWTTYVGFNLRDQIRESELDDDQAVPLQFRYEAADCRLYYTLHNLFNMTQQWRDVANAAWDNYPSLCVAGSTGYSTTGQNKPKSKAPSTSKTIDYGINADDYSPPAGSEVLSHLEFTGGNLVDGKYKPPEFLELDECQQDTFGDYYCPSKRGSNSKAKPCVEVNIQCKSGKKDKKGKPITTPIHVCLPSCSDGPSCGDYDPEYEMHCSAFTQVEQKASAAAMGQDDTNTELRTFRKNVGWAKVCKPKYGTKDLGSCPAAKPVKSGRI